MDVETLESRLDNLDGELELCIEVGDYGLNGMKLVPVKNVDALYVTPDRAVARLRTDEPA